MSMCVSFKIIVKAMVKNTEMYCNLIENVFVLEVGWYILIALVVIYTVEKKNSNCNTMLINHFHTLKICFCVTQLDFHPIYFT